MLYFTFSIVKTRDVWFLAKTCESSSIVYPTVDTYWYQKIIVQLYTSHCIPQNEFINTISPKLSHNKEWIFNEKTILSHINMFDLRHKQQVSLNYDLSFVFIWHTLDTPITVTVWHRFADKHLLLLYGICHVFTKNGVSS